MSEDDPHKTHPDFTFVIGARDAPADLRRCIESLTTLPEIDSMQVIVASCPELPAELKHKFPFVTWVSAGDRSNLAKLRGLALACVRAEWVFLSEPFCTYPKDFIPLLRQARVMDADVVGGSVAVEPAASQVGWASAFFEYGAFFPPLDSKMISQIPSNNVLYRRSILEPIDQWVESGFWKYFVHERLYADGRRFAVQPERNVIHHPPYTFLTFLLRTYHHARTFGAMRALEISITRKVFWILRVPLLPFLFTFRLLRGCLSKKPYRIKLFSTLPLVFIFFGTWALGEGLGVLLGEGISGEKVY